MHFSFSTNFLLKVSGFSKTNFEYKQPGHIDQILYLCYYKDLRFAY